MIAEFALKISVVLPMFDRRGAGWRPLESALTQTLDRRAFEVIAITARPFAGDPPLDARARAMLARCDVVVNVDVDPNRTDQEIPILLTGYAKTTGDVLFFAEGHTVLEPDCCATIAAYFRDHPQTQIAWAPRIHHHRTPLGALIGVHSKHHETLAADRGGFWLGANSAITRGLFERLGRLDADYQRYAERVLCERVIRDEFPIATLPQPLATHYDDVSRGQLIGIGAAAGVAKFRYYNLPASDADAPPTRIRHGIYRVANRAAIAGMLLPVSRVLAACLLRAAVVAFGLSRARAYPLFVLGLGFSDLTGYCKECLRTARARSDPGSVVAAASPAPRST